MRSFTRGFASQCNASKKALTHVWLAISIVGVTATFSATWPATSPVAWAKEPDGLQTQTSKPGALIRLKRKLIKPGPSQLTLSPYELESRLQTYFELEARFKAVVISILGNVGPVALSSAETSPQVETPPIFAFDFSEYSLMDKIRIYHETVYNLNQYAESELRDLELQLKSRNEFALVSFRSRMIKTVSEISKLGFGLGLGTMAGGVISYIAIYAQYGRYAFLTGVGLTVSSVITALVNPRHDIQSIDPRSKSTQEALQSLAGQLPTAEGLFEKYGSFLTTLKIATKHDLQIFNMSPNDLRNHVEVEFQNVVNQVDKEIKDAGFTRSTQLQTELDLLKTDTRGFTFNRVVPIAKGSPEDAALLRLAMRISERTQTFTQSYQLAFDIRKEKTYAGGQCLFLFYSPR